MGTWGHGDMRTEGQGSAYHAGAVSYEAVIGLEIHAQLLTHTKIFCGCSTAFGAPPNTQVCPVCLGLPGALPVLNRRAVELATRAALALGCQINERSIFARKNYFYPDLPKGYQISQYDQPLASGGHVRFEQGGETREAGITRVHLEEDAGKSLHEGFADSAERTYVDYNRAGVPLIEIVTEPDLRNAGDASAFFEHLRATLVWLGVNDGNMEEGSLRCDANVSVRRAGESKLGTKAEVKNLNSFRYLRHALEYEIDRQIDIVEHGGRVDQETRLWDQATSRTIAMRSKEEAHDYRYFPEPDLPPIEMIAARVAEIAGDLPELPAARRARFMAEYRLPAYDAIELTRERDVADYYESVVAQGAPPKTASNWVMGEMARKLNDGRISIREAPVQAQGLAALIALIDRGTISTTTAKDVLEKMWATGRAAKDIVERDGLAQISDESAIAAAVDGVIASHAETAAQYRAGQTKVLGFLVGQVMKATGGKASPKLANELVRRALERP
jgi:aspartyl-tRNA(Asn)/glutamyl-tRNA(Gln) amidotransferase subunit B